MSKGLGRLERFIEVEIDITKGRKNLSVHLRSSALTFDAFRPADYYRGPRDDDGNLIWQPSRANQKAVLRAMHSFVRKFPQYGLMGGKGRKSLYLYEKADPISVMWAGLSVANKGFVSQGDAKKALQMRG